MDDVIIIGGGPVGTGAAYFLTEQGFKVRVIERATEKRPGSKAIGIHGSTLKILEKFDMADALIEKGVKIQGARIYDVDKQIGQINFSHTPSPYNFILSVPQINIESLFESELKKKNVPIENGKRLVFYRQTKDYVEITLNGPEGLEVVQSRYILGADGAHSLVRDIAGLDGHKKTYQLYIDIMDIQMNEALSPYAHTHLNEHGGVIVYIPISRDTYRVIRPVPNEQIAFKESEVKSGTILWHSQFIVHKSLSKKGKSGRVLLCGDAFHQMSPAGGLGLNSGIGDAFLLAQYMKEGKLSKYSCHRKKDLRKILAHTDMASRLMFSQSYWLKKRILMLLSKTWVQKRLVKRNLK